MIEIDGSYGEGGGQIIRTCLSLSAITGKPFSISNIRAGRTKPGLQPQHLAAVKAAGAICSGRLEGAYVGSTFLTFTPGSSVQPGEYRFEIGTAGAATLVAQTVLLPLCLTGGNSQVNIIGGTHVPHSPPAEYLRDVYLLALKEAGFAVGGNYGNAGFFPKGGGTMELSCNGFSQLVPLTFAERGKVSKLTAHIVTAGLPDHVSQRGAATVRTFMKGIGRQVEIVEVAKQSLGPGAAVILICHCEGGLAGFTSIGERGKPMEKVAEQACAEFMQWWKSGAACDEHLADQLVLPAALTDGQSEWTSPRVTDHLRTVLWTVRRFIEIEESLNERTDGSATVTVRGNAIRTR